MVSIFTYTEAKLLSLAVEILPVSPTIRVVQANLQPVSSFLRFRDEFRRGNEEEAENQQNSEHVDLLRLYSQTSRWVQCNSTGRINSASQITQFHFNSFLRNLGSNCIYSNLPAHFEFLRIPQSYSVRSSIHA